MGIDVTVRDGLPGRDADTLTLPDLESKTTVRELIRTRVREEVATYKIHLGSANVLMEPNDEYLCIVAARGSASRKASTVFLPFEDDARLSLILSKAFMLAEDAKIDDRAIVDQIKRG